MHFFCSGYRCNCINKCIHAQLPFESLSPRNCLKEQRPRDDAEFDPDRNGIRVHVLVFGPVSCNDDAHN